MTEQLKHIYNLISTLHPMDDIDERALNQAKASLVQLIAKDEKGGENKWS